MFAAAAAQLRAFEQEHEMLHPCSFLKLITSGETLQNTDWRG